ncbi:unnamed protein product [Cuscuta epithymum]|uniref:Uncharacterized protein n=1 Tax=Cuscuta epithymum TaxID=186058 RepID=A0AAV0DTX6_9ASTE|nr:unnamed protein product [Cuscuta epithymum]
MLGFRRFRLAGEDAEKYPLIDRGYQNAGGQVMDVSSYAALKKKLTREPNKKKETGTQKPVGEFFKKDRAAQIPEGEGPSKIADAGTDVGGSKVEELKRKNAGKGVMPPEKKGEEEALEKKDASVIIIEEHSTSRSPAADPPPSSQLQAGEEFSIAEIIQFPIKAGTGILRATLHPVGFMRGVMSSDDKAVLAQMEDVILDYEVASYSTMAALAASEQARRAEQLRIAKAQADEALKKSEDEKASLRKKLEVAEKSLRLEQEGFNKILQDSKTVAKAEGKAEAKAEAEKIVAAAVEEAEKAKKEAVSQAGKDGVAAFLVGGWKAGDHKQWLSSVVEAIVDD